MHSWLGVCEFPESCNNMRESKCRKYAYACDVYQRKVRLRFLMDFRRDRCSWGSSGSSERSESWERERRNGRKGTRQEVHPHFLSRFVHGVRPIVKLRASTNATSAPERKAALLQPCLICPEVGFSPSRTNAFRLLYGETRELRPAKT